jgi:3-oxoacyl-[acyl-carrier-protein] synthase II
MTGFRAAVTGMGLMTGLGLDLESSWRGILAASSPIRRFTLFDPGDLGASYGVELPDGADAVFEQRITKRRRSQMTRGTMIACVTAGMAIEDAGLDLGTVDLDRVGVVAGATGTGYVAPPSGSDPHRILRNMANAPASWISLCNRLAGPSFVISTACSSGTYALAAGCDLLQNDLCDVVVAGSADSSINYPDVEGFSSIMALSENEEQVETASRPFDRRRGGFVMGEGGGFLVLERLEHATRRGARVHAVMARPALTSETYNIISPQPGGVGMTRAMRLALELAGLRPDQIDYVNAHGTSTRLNDLYEAQAIEEVFGGHARQLAVSSTKGQTGHCLAGAAGVEAVICCKALVEGVIPATVNLTEPDEEIRLDVVAGKPRPANLRRVMSNSFAFGGHNGTCIFTRPEAE